MSHVGASLKVRLGTTYKKTATVQFQRIPHVGKLDSGVMMHQHVTLKCGTTYKKSAVYSCMTGFTLKGSFEEHVKLDSGVMMPTCDLKVRLGTTYKNVGASSLHCPVSPHAV